MVGQEFALVLCPAVGLMCLHVQSALCGNATQQQGWKRNEAESGLGHAPVWLVLHILQLYMQGAVLSLVGLKFSHAMRLRVMLNITDRCSGLINIDPDVL